MRKLCLLIILPLVLSAPIGCELWPRSAGSVIHVAIGLTYEGTGISALKAPPIDAKCLSRAFGQLYEDRPFYSKVLEDEEDGEQLTKDRLADILNDTMKRLTPSDLLIISYSGHGWTDGSWALYPAAGQPFFDEEKQINESALLKVEELFGLLAQSPAPVLLLSDSCYSGNFIGDSSSSVSTDEGHKLLAEAYAQFFASDRYAKEVFVMAATTEDHSSHEPMLPAHSHGYFTAALLEGMNWDCNEKALTKQSNYLTADGLYHYIYTHQRLPTEPGSGFWYQRPMIVGGPLDLVLVSR